MTVSADNIRNSRRVCNEFYSRVISARISPYFSAAFIRMGISANAVTFMMLIAGIIFPLMMLSHNIVVQMTGALCLPLINVFDTSDGEVARYSKATSDLGVYADKVFQLVIDINIYVVVAMLLFRQAGNVYYSVPAVISLLLYMVDIVSKEIFMRMMSRRPDMENHKAAIRFQKKSILKYFVHITSSNTGICHIIWAILLLDYLVYRGRAVSALFVYTTYLALCQLMKLILRQRSVYVLLREEPHPLSATDSCDEQAV